MRFILKLELGNDAMQTYGDIAEVLARHVKRIRDLDGHPPEEGDASVILDANGLRVGRWEIRE